jgi:hypothetical protein
MAVRTTEPLPAQLLRLLTAPPLFGALVAAALSFIRSRTQPSLPRMSDEWLQSLDRGPGRDFDSWR